MSHQALKTSHQQFIDEIKSKGLKVTRARSELITTLLSFSKPFTADEVIQELRAKEVSVHRATIYRDIHHFTQIGILSELVFQGLAASYYELSSTIHHHHFVCQQCFAIYDVFPSQAEEALYAFEQQLAQQGLQTTHHHLKFYGICRTCNTKL